MSLGSDKVKIILATHNENKVIEIRRMIHLENQSSIEIVSLEDLKEYDEVEETGKSFDENALIKAKYYYEKYHLPSLADDSGLVVPALHGAPGIYSARYSGGNDEDNNQFLLKNMKDITDRSAFYSCTICYYDGLPHYFNGKVYGTIGYTEVGEHGFGYDPLFYVGKRTLAQFSMDEKNKISHRGIALQKFMKFLHQK